jgi:hypothetical protein
VLPQPSSLPHGLRLHVGAHPHWLLVPPPPHVSGEVQAPPVQQG